MSTLEELFNKGKLKPGSYPQLIRTLQRDRNAARKELKVAADNIARLSEYVRTAREMIAEERYVIESNKH